MFTLNNNNDNKDDNSPSLPPGFPLIVNVPCDYASVGDGDGDGGDDGLDSAPDPDDDEDNHFDNNGYGFYEPSSKPHDFTMKYTKE